MDRDGWHKSMSHFTSMCCSSPLKPQVLLCDGHGRNFYDRALDILHIQNIQSLILKSDDYVNDQPNNNGPNTKLKNLYVNSIMTWMRHHGTLKFTPDHMNSVLIDTWKNFKISSATITQNSFKKTHITPRSPSYIGTYHRDFLAGIQQ